MYSLKADMLSLSKPLLHRNAYALANGQFVKVVWIGVNATLTFKARYVNGFC